MSAGSLAFIILATAVLFYLWACRRHMRQHVFRQTDKYSRLISR